MSVSIHIKNVKKIYEDNEVIKDLSADVQGGELFTLLGPSGCGKTTLLRMIAGFNSIEHGTIAFDDTVINDIPVHKRSFGMVFQNYAIFPNMTVYKNIEYGLKNKHLSKEEIKSRVEEMMEIVQITQYKDRYPDKLSGGQQQRVALARAIAIRPEVLLMDEPLSNLDAKLRLEMREAIRRIQKKIGITTLYVTHDQEEALAISDRIAIINKGDIQQIETPERIYLRPYNTFVANFIGHSNVIDGKIVSQNKKETTILVHDSLKVKVKGVVEAKALKKIDVYVRPEEFIASHYEEGKQGIPGTVSSKQFLGKFINYFIDIGLKEPIEVSSDIEDVNKIFEVGEKVLLNVNVARINIFNPKTGITMMNGVSSNVKK